MGRKKEPPRAAVRLTESEKKKIEAAAAKCGKIPRGKRDATAVLLGWDLDGIMTVKYKKDSRSSKNVDKRRSFLS